MKKIYLFILLLITVHLNSYSQGVNCVSATPFCTAVGTPFTFPNSTNTTSPSGPSYGCLATQPNPAWFFLQTTAAGTMTFNISQVSGGGSGIDVDFVAYGPFSSMVNACNSLTGSCSPGTGCINCDQSCSGNIEDCSYSTSDVEAMNLVSPGPGNFFIILITNYSDVAGNITFTQTGGPATNCQITCPSVTSGPGFLQVLGGGATGAMPSTVACNSSTIGMIASNQTPFGNPITPAILIGFNNNANNGNTVNWYENGTFILCSGPAGNGCTLPLTSNQTNNLQYSTMSPSLPNTITLCEPNTGQPNMTYQIIDAHSGAVISSGTWTDDGACQTINIPAGTLSGAAAYTISPACAGCLATTDWGYGTFNPANATPGTTYTITYTFNPPGSCANYVFSHNITVTNPYNAAWTAPAAICANAAAINLTTLLNGGATAGGTWSGPGVSGTTFTPSSAGSGSHTITYTVGSGLCSATQTGTIVVNPLPVATATPSSQTICSGSVTGISLSSSIGGTTFNWTVVQSGVTGATNGSGSSIAQTLNATGSSAGTATYTITPTAGGCNGNPITVTITVNPRPVATATPSTQTICSGAASSIALSSNVAGTTFSWTVSQSGATGASASSGSSIAQTLTATGTSAGTVTYTITPSANGCTGTPISVTVTVNPRPVATATPSSQTFCSGNSTSIALSSNVAGTTFSWTVAQSGVTGASAGSGTSIVQALSTTGTSSGTATYTITPSAGGCPGTPITVVITVNPIPNVTATPSSQTICSGTNTAINLTSTTVGANFNWTVSQSGVSGAAAGSGSSISQTLTATGSSAGTVTYTITPNFGGCNGTPINVVVTVNPRPVATATPNSQTLCSGSATSIALSSNVGGTTFSWTVSQSGVTGATASSGSSITQTLNATGATAGTVTYTITPSFGGCAGTPINVTITVNPRPVATATPSSQTFCTGGTTGINLSSNVSGTTYSWTVVQSGVAGASAGSGSSITQTLSTTGATAGTATYTITPSANGCTGTPITVTITVNPLDNASFTYGSSTYCQTGTNPTPTITGLAGGTFTSTPAGLNINPSTGLINLAASALNTYTVTYSTSGVCPNTSSVNITVTSAPLATFSYSGPYCQGATPNPSPTFSVGASAGSFSATPAGLVFINTNTGQVNLAASTPGSYTVTNSIPAGGGCAATSATNSITINPAPVATATPATSSICSGSATAIALTSSLGATSFSWTVVQSGVTGAGASSGTSIAQTLNTTSTSPGTATYTITPVSGGCTGLPIVATVTVNPIPVATATPSTQTLCSGNVTAINLTSNVASTTFAWTVVQAGVSGAAAGSGSSISQTLAATGSTPGTATYTITPSANGCSGTPVTVTITVNPVPFATATPATQTICSGTATSIALSSFTAGTTYSWTVVQSGVTGASANSGSSIAQTLSTTGATPGTATYTITPSANGCIGTPLNVTITVNPIPTVSATPTTQTICSGAATSILLNGSVTGTTFAWTVSQTAASGASAGSGTSIAQTLNATTASTGTVVYTITPTANGCSGTPVTATITINPIPVATATPSTQTICSGAATAINLTSNVTGSTFNWTVVQTGVTGASTGSGSSITQTLSNAGTTSGTAVYTITPSANGCTGTPITATVTVNPIPVVTATPSSQTICSGTATGIVLSSSVASSSYSWTVSQTGATGATANNGSSITQTLTATGTVAGNVVYTVTPSAAGCPGTPITVNITVNPTPVVTATPTSQTFCDGGTTSITLSSNVSGTSISWTSVQSGVTGASNSSGVTIADLLNTTGTTAGTATYTITPIAASCPGTPVTVTITVNPIDNATFTYPGATFCQTGANPVATITGLAGGVFSSTPAGLTLNPATGGIVLSTSVVGTYDITYQTNGVCPSSSTITINITNAPTGDFTLPSPICSSNANVLPTFGASSSAGLFSSNPSSGISFVSTNTGEINVAASTPGTYWIINSIAAAGGCAATADSTQIIIDQSALVDAGLASAVCEAGSVTLAGTQSGSTGSITWTTAGSGTFSNSTSLTSDYSPSAADVTAGSVMLTITTDDPTGVCPVVTDSVLITVNTLSDASFTYNGTTYCQTGTNPVATVSGLPGGVFSSTAGLVFVSTATGEVDLAASTLGTYTVTYSAGGTCPNTSTQTLTITSAPSATFTFTSGASSFCQTDANPTPLFGAGGSAGVFSVNPSGLTFVNATTGEIDLANSAVGTYSIINTIVPAGGCALAVDSISITINQPAVVSAGTAATSTICASDPFVITGSTIGGSASSSTWTSNGTGTFDNASLLNPTYTPSAADITAGTVLLTITSDDPAGVCGPVSDTLTLTITPLPVSPVVSATSPSSCLGSTIPTVTATGSAINWYSDSLLTTQVGTGNSFTPVITNTTTFWVSETANGCESLPTPVTFTINPLPVVDTTNTTLTTADCGTNTGSITGIVLVSGQPTVTYVWQDSLGSTVGTSLDLTNVGPGNYTLTVTDGNGCITQISASQFTVTSTNAVVAAFTATPNTGETPLLVQFTNASVGAVNYVWNFGTGLPSTLQDPSFTYNQVGAYTACLYADNGIGCADTACVTIDVYINSTFVIPNVFSPNDDGTNDVFGVQNKGLETMDAEVYNRWGQKEYEWHTTNGGWDGRTASGVPAPDGTYYYIIKAKGFDGKEYFEKGSFTLVR
jgi:gliding motility-associated-like protein